MEETGKPTLSEMASQFLASLKQAKRQVSQPEVTKFARWCGMDRLLSDVTRREVEQYASTLGNSPDGAKSHTHVKQFLTYAYKQEATRVNLAPSFKLKKTAIKYAETQRAAAAVTQLTAEGHRRLEEELAELKNGRGAIAEEIRNAAADKDFRENAPLEAAREHQSKVESRIRQIEASLRTAVVMDQKRVRKTSQVELGLSVVVRHLSYDEELTYLLVAPHEANLAEGKLSAESPVGKALLGSSPGDEVEVKVPAGTFKYRIERINA